jgi:hypothetical protein
MLSQEVYFWIVITVTNDNKTVPMGPYLTREAARTVIRDYNLCNAKIRPFPSRSLSAITRTLVEESIKDQ